MRGITVDTIMEKVRLEIARRRSGDVSSGCQPTEDVPERFLSDELEFVQDRQHTAIWRIVKKIQRTLQKCSCYDFIYEKIAIRFRDMIPKYRRSHTIDDFLKYHGEEFIQNAYWAILKREPDPQGHDFYLKKLKEGQQGRIEILGNIRFSPEGRKKRVKIRGILPRFLMYSSYKLPIAGPLMRVLTSIITLPIHIKRLNALDAKSYHSEKQLGVIRGALSEKVDVRTLAKARDEIHNEMRRKANVEEITKILTEVREKLGNTLLISAHLKEEKQLLDELYVAFEDRFRGSRNDIKERLSVYINTIEPAKDVIGSALILDLGCGRGEWLELLKERGYKAKGIDQNSVMVRQCRDLALDVTEQDVIEFLSQQPPNSLGAITGFHLVEHLSFLSLITLLDECLRVLKPGGLVIFETPNPENLMVGAFSFYFDPSHRNPLPPGTLKFLIEQRGFVNTSVMKLHKYSDLIDVHDGDDFKNKWFYSDMDYSVIAYKNA